jgi:hypothetical protein
MSIPRRGRKDEKPLPYHPASGGPRLPKTYSLDEIIEEHIFL